VEDPAARFDVFRRVQFFKQPIGDRQMPVAGRLAQLAMLRDPRRLRFLISRLPAT
jgi:hypothetical protein